MTTPDTTKATVLLLSLSARKPMATQPTPIARHPRATAVHTAQLGIEMVTSVEWSCNPLKKYPYAQPTGRPTSDRIKPTTAKLSSIPSSIRQMNAGTPPGPWVK